MNGKRFLTLLGMLALAALLALTVTGCSYTVDRAAVDNFSMVAKTNISVTGTATVAGDLGSAEGIVTLGPAVVLSSGVVSSDTTAIAAALAEAERGYGATMDMTPIVESDANFGSTATTPTVLTPGVYTTDSGLIILQHRLVLDSEDATNTAFVFICDELSNAVGASVETTRGATAGNVVWIVRGGATLTDANIVGSVVAADSVYVEDSIVDGRLFSLNGPIDVVGVNGNMALTRSSLAAAMPTIPEAVVPVIPVVPVVPVLPTTGVGPQDGQKTVLLLVALGCLLGAVALVIHYRWKNGKKNVETKDDDK